MAVELDLFNILRVLSRNEVEFIVVGGVAAILEGAPVSTLDLDIMHRRTDENHIRLLNALGELNARYRDLAGRRIVPDTGKLRTFHLHRLVTDSGPLDILTEIGPGLAWEDLIGRTVIYEVADVSVRVLTLEAVIESKEHANRDKDQAALNVLRRTLQLKNQ